MNLFILMLAVTWGEPSWSDELRLDPPTRSPALVASEVEETNLPASNVGLSRDFSAPEPLVTRSAWPATSLIERLQDSTKSRSVAPAHPVQ